MYTLLMFWVHLFCYNSLTGGLIVFIKKFLIYFRDSVFDSEFLVKTDYTNTFLIETNHFLVTPKLHVNFRIT